MYSDKSFYEIVNILISNNEGISISKISAKLSKSRSVVYYNIEKINDQLRKKKIKEISNDYKKGIILDVQQKTILESILLDLEYIFNKNERQLIICLFIITYPTRQTISEYMDMFKTSKNSILADIQQIKEEVTKFNKNIKIEYSSKLGYFLKGDDLIQVQYLYRLIKKITKLNNPNLNKFIISKYRKIDKVFSLEFEKNLMGKMQFIQNRLGKTMSNRSVENYAFSIPYIYLLSKKTKGNTIEKKLSILKERLEYKVIDEICKVFEFEYSINIEEKMKLLSSLILLCTRKMTDLHNSSKDYIKHYNLAKKIVDNFNKESNYIIKDTERAVDSLVTYFKVQYFRNKYNIIFVDLDYDKIVREHKNIYDTVKLISKNENLKFDEYDQANIIMQLSLFIDKKKIKILIVSKEEDIIKKNIIKKILDYISNVEIVAVVDKNNLEKNYNKLDVDLIVSTEMDININYNALIVDNLLGKSDLQRIFKKITEINS